MANSIPNYNFVGKLQETCTKLKLNQPEYCEDSGAVTPLKQFECSCRVGKWSSIGFGLSKKNAKQNAAQEMIKIVENENAQEVNEKSVIEVKAVSKLAIYCVKEQLEPPLYSEKPMENGLFAIECTVKGFSGIGKGPNKKIAKESAADLVATHFKVHEYYNALVKTDARRNSLKNPTTCLHELCQTRKLQITFTEKKVFSDKVEKFIVTCQVGEEITESSANSSKKNAKKEVAQLMLNILIGQTPEASPPSPPLSEGGEASNEDQQANLVSVGRKRRVSNETSECYSDDTRKPEVCDNSSDDEPLCKRSNLVS